MPTADPALTGNQSLFVNFFEDKDATADNNRNSWTALELARYLIEQRDAGLDPLWRTHVDALLNYALTLFSSHPGLGNATLVSALLMILVTFAPFTRYSVAQPL